MFLGVIVLMVDPDSYGYVLVLGRGGYENFLSARSQVQLSLLPVSEQARALEGHIDIQFLPGQLCRVLFGGDLYFLAVQDYRIAFYRYFGGYLAEYRIVLQEVGKGRGVGHIVYADELDLVEAPEGGPGKVSPYAAKTVNRNPYHLYPSVAAFFYPKGQ